RWRKRPEKSRTRPLTALAGRAVVALLRGPRLERAACIPGQHAIRARIAERSEGVSVRPYEQLGGEVRTGNDGGEGDRLLGTQPVAQRVVDLAAHQSSGSTNRCTVPPHVNPTSNASSSEYPNEITPRSRLPSSTASASVTTAPSTQPPDTEPATSPASLTAIVAPGSRGPEPSTPTRRATATR